MSRRAGVRILLLLSIVLSTSIGWTAPRHESTKAATHLRSQPVEYAGQGTATYSVSHEGNSGSCTAQAAIEKLVLDSDGTYRGRLYRYANYYWGYTPSPESSFFVTCDPMGGRAYQIITGTHSDGNILSIELDVCPFWHSCTTSFLGGTYDEFVIEGLEFSADSSFSGTTERMYWRFDSLVAESAGIVLKASKEGYRDGLETVENPDLYGSVLISGQVIDSGTEQPIAEATVEIIAGAVEATTTTDSYGYYSITAVVPGGEDEGEVEIDFALQPLSVLLKASKEGYSSQRIQVDNPDDHGRVDVSGCVTDRTTGEPLAGATVEVATGADPATTTTDADGDYDITVIVPGGQGERSVDGIDFELQLLTITLRASKTGYSTEDTEVDNDEYLGSVELSGYVTDESTGNPIGGAKVQIVSGAQPAEDTTGPYGWYALTAAVPGGQGEGALDDVDFALSSKAENLELTVTPRTWMKADGIDTVHLIAKVTDADGNGVAGHEVRFTREPFLGNFSATSGTTDESGEFGVHYTAPPALGLGPDERVVTIVATSDQLGDASVEIELRTHSLEITVSPAILTADGVSQATVRIEAQDYEGNPASYERILLDPPIKGTFSSHQVTTNYAGSCEVTYTAPQPEELDNQQGEHETLVATSPDHWAKASVKLKLEGLKPEITKVEAKYKGIWLEGIGFPNTYKVTVDWNGQKVTGNGEPGRVKFDLNGTVYEEPGNQTGASHEFDMGNPPMRAGSDGGKNTLTITAWSADGKRASDPVIRTPYLIELGWLGWAAGSLTPTWLVNWGWEQDGVYKGSLALPEPAFKKSVDMGDLPYVGGVWGIEETQASGEVEYKTSGTLSSQFKGQSGIKVGGHIVGGEASYKLEADWKKDKGLDLTAAEFGIYVWGMVKDECSILGVVPSFDLEGAIRTLPWDWGDKAVAWLKKYAKVESQLTCKAGVAATFHDKDDTLDFLTGSGEVSVQPQVALALGADESWLTVKVIGSGEPKLVLKYPTDPEGCYGWVKEASVNLQVTVMLAAYGLGPSFAMPVKYVCPSGKGAQGWELASVGPITVSEAAPLDRGYLAVGDYARFHPEGLPAVPGVTGGTQETRLVENVCSMSHPALAAAENGNAVVVWTHDDPGKTALQGFEIVASLWDGVGWSPPVTITNDTHPDYYPQVAFDGSGNAVAVWERSRNPDIVPDAEMDADFIADMEIAYAVYNIATDSWSGVDLLTDDAYFDHGPKLVTGPDGHVMAVWITNEGNAFWSEASSPDVLNYAIWNGASWTAPQVVVGDLTDTWGWDFDFRGDAAILVVSRGSDQDVATVDDADLYRSDWNGTTWGALTRVSDDQVMDRAPSVRYDSAGQPSLTWWKEGQIHLLQGDWSGAPVPVLQDPAIGLGDYELVRDASDNLVIIWQGTSQDGTDIYYSVYDEQEGVWGLRQRLTADLPTDSLMSPAFLPNGELMMAYNKSEIVYEDVEAEVDGQTFIIADVADFGRDDLYVLRHTLGRDLAMEPEDLSLSHQNPGPGASVVISATVHNLGDLTATDVGVAFYDGDPDDGGLQIGSTQQIPSVGGGMTATVSTPWTAPTDDQTHWVFARADVDGQIPEWDESNNTTGLPAVLPDLWIGDTMVWSTAADTHDVSAWIGNAGQALSPPATIDLRLGTVTGTLLSNVSLPQIAPGAGQIVTMTLDTGSLPTGSHRVHIVADSQDAVAEAYEENNAGYAVVRVLPDLAVNADDIEFWAASDERYGVRLTVHNVGQRTAENVSVTLTHGNPQDGAPICALAEIVDEIPAGGEVILSGEWWGARLGRDVYLHADSDYSIEEANEGNNLAVVAYDSVPHNGRVALPLVMRDARAVPVPPDATPTPTRSATPRATTVPTHTTTPTVARPSTTPTKTPTRTNTPTPTRAAAQSPTPSRTATPTRTPTRTPTATRTPTRTPTLTRTPTRTPTRTKSPTCTATPVTPIYFDDFSDPGSGWLISDHAKYALSYVNGNYRIAVKEPNLLIRSVSNFTCSDSTIQVEAWREEGGNSAYGILFGVSADGFRHYLFRIQPARKEYALHRIDESTWVTLIPWTVSPMINTYDGRNTLLVRRHGSLIELYVNGELLDSYVDGTYTGTRGVGLAAVSGSTSPVSLRYDNFTVWGADYTPAQVMMRADAAIAVPVPSGVDP